MKRITKVELTHPDASCSPSAGSTTCNGVQGGNDVDGYIEIIKRVCFGKQLKPRALEWPKLT